MILFSSPCWWKYLLTITMTNLYICMFTLHLHWSDVCRGEFFFPPGVAGFFLSCKNYSFKVLKQPCKIIHDLSPIGEDPVKKYYQKVQKYSFQKIFTPGGWWEVCQLNLLQSYRTCITLRIYLIHLNLIVCSISSIQMPQCQITTADEFLRWQTDPIFQARVVLTTFVSWCR